jgi:hypothetical protein
MAITLVNLLFIFFLLKGGQFWVTPLNDNVDGVQQIPENWGLSVEAKGCFSLLNLQKADVKNHGLMRVIRFYY